MMGQNADVLIIICGKQEQSIKIIAKSLSNLNMFVYTGTRLRWKFLVLKTVKKYGKR